MTTTTTCNNLELVLSNGQRGPALDLDPQLLDDPAEVISLADQLVLLMRPLKQRPTTNAELIQRLGALHQELLLRRRELKAAAHAALMAKKGSAPAPTPAPPPAPVEIPRHAPPSAPPRPKKGPGYETWESFALQRVVNAHDLDALTRGEQIALRAEIRTVVDSIDPRRRNGDVPAERAGATEFKRSLGVFFLEMLEVALDPPRPAPADETAVDAHLRQVVRQNVDAATYQRFCLMANQHQLGALGAGGTDRVVHHRRRIGVGAGVGDHRHAAAFAPHGHLLHGAGPEGVGGGDQAAVATAPRRRPGALWGMQTVTLDLTETETAESGIRIIKGCIPRHREVCQWNDQGLPTLQSIPTIHRKSPT